MVGLRRRAQWRGERGHSALGSPMRWRKVTGGSVMEAEPAVETMLVVE